MECCVLCFSPAFAAWCKENKKHCHKQAEASVDQPYLVPDRAGSRHMKKPCCTLTMMACATQVPSFCC